MMGSGVRIPLAAPALSSNTAIVKISRVSVGVSTDPLCPAAGFRAVFRGVASLRRVGPAGGGFAAKFSAHNGPHGSHLEGPVRPAPARGAPPPPAARPISRCVGAPIHDSAIDTDIDSDRDSVLASAEDFGYRDAELVRRIGGTLTEMSPSPTPPDPPASGEPLRDFLIRRDRELTQQIAALRGQLAVKEKDQVEIRKAMTAVGLYAEQLRPMVDNDPLALSYNNPLALSRGGVLVGALSQMNSAHTPPALALSSPVLTAGTPLTIKEMILNALKDHFREGATPADLRGYIRVAYGREIDRNSISPQLARLREEGVVEQMLGLLNEGKWQLKEAARQKAFYGGGPEK
jgi:hypothetical protein